MTEAGAVCLSGADFRDSSEDAGGSGQQRGQPGPGHVFSLHVLIGEVCIEENVFSLNTCLLFDFLIFFPVCFRVTIGGNCGVCGGVL